MTRDETIEEAYRIITIADTASDDTESVEWNSAVCRELKSNAIQWRETISRHINQVVRGYVKSV